MLAGGYLTFQVIIVLRFATAANGAPPILRPPLVDFVSQLFDWSLGPTNAVTLIGAALLVAGVAVLGRSAWSRRSGQRTKPVREPEALSVEPAGGPEIVELR